MLLVFIDYGSHDIYSLSMTLQYIYILLVPICAYMYARVLSLVTNMIKTLYIYRYDWGIPLYLLSTYLISTQLMVTNTKFAVLLLTIINSIILISFTLGNDICKYAAIIFTLITASVFDFGFYVAQSDNGFKDFEFLCCAYLCVFVLYITLTAMVEYTKYKSSFLDNPPAILVLLLTATMNAVLINAYYALSFTYGIGSKMFSVGIGLYSLEVLALVGLFAYTMLYDNNHYPRPSRPSMGVRLLIFTVKKIKHFLN